MFHTRCNRRTLPYFPGPATTIGLTAPQSVPTNFAVNVLSIVILIALPPELPDTVVWLLPLKCSASID